MIKVKKLVKRFGIRPVLNGLDFEVSSGEFVGLLGPNGAGKTTFLRILASLSRPTLGSVKLAGYFLPEQAIMVRRKLGVLSHQPMLYAELTAMENLQFFGKMYSIDNLDNKIKEVLGIVDLSKRGRDLVRTFSRGMQQRLAISRAILHDPDILLFDEPYTGLDQDACSMLDEVLIQIADQGRTVVMTSHDITRIQTLARRFDVLSRGKITSSIMKDALPKDGLLAFYRQAIQGSENVN